MSQTRGGLRSSYLARKQVKERISFVKKERQKNMGEGKNKCTFLKVFDFFFGFVIIIRGNHRIIYSKHGSLSNTKHIL